MRILSHMTRLATRRQWDDDAKDTTPYVARTLEAICSENMHCFSMNVYSDKEGIFLIWCLRREQKRDAPRTKCWVHSCFNKGKNTAVFLEPRTATRTVTDLNLFTGWHRKVLNFVHSLITRIFPVVQNKMFPDKFRNLNICFLFLSA
jgi:hypothetical protein